MGASRRIIRNIRDTEVASDERLRQIRPRENRGIRTARTSGLRRTGIVSALVVVKLQIVLYLR
jgi:hypothetical protein